MSALRLLDEENAAQMEVRPEVQRSFNEHIQAELVDAVWSAGGCMSWYLDADGRNRTLWPDSTITYWLATRRVDKGDYRLRRPASADAVRVPASRNGSGGILALGREAVTAPVTGLLDLVRAVDR
jgi:hypothetical protein